ncbi:hypothetical protein QJQ45_016917, partial [Haematococcus lacustris]
MLVVASLAAAAAQTRVGNVTFLQEAVALASDISLDQGVYTLSATLLVRTRSLRITGQGPGITVLDCGGLAISALSVQSSGTYVVSNLSISNCQDTPLVFNLMTNNATTYQLHQPLSRVELQQVHVVNCSGFPAAGAWVRGAGVSLLLQSVVFQGNQGREAEQLYPSPSLDRGGSHTLLAELFLPTSSFTATGLTLDGNGGPTAGPTAANTTSLYSTLGIHFEGSNRVPLAYLPPGTTAASASRLPRAALPQLVWTDFTATGNQATQFSAAHISCEAGCSVSITGATIANNSCLVPSPLAADVAGGLSDAARQDPPGRLGFKLRRPAALAVLGSDGHHLQAAGPAPALPASPFAAGMVASVDLSPPTSLAGNGSSLSIVVASGLLVQGNQGCSGVLLGSSWWVAAAAESLARLGPALAQSQVAWGANVYLAQSLFDSNVAPQFLGAAGLTLLGTGPTTLRDCSFTANTIPGTGDPTVPSQPWADPTPYGYVGSGAGVYVEQVGSSLEVVGTWDSERQQSSCSFTGSKVPGGCGAMLLLGANQTVAIEGCAIYNNPSSCNLLMVDDASSAGNSSLVMRDCHVTGNYGGNGISIPQQGVGSSFGVVPPVTTAAVAFTVIKDCLFSNNMFGAMYAIGTTSNTNEIVIDNCVIE